MIFEDQKKNRVKNTSETPTVCVYDYLCVQCGKHGLQEASTIV